MKGETGKNFDILELNRLFLPEGQSKNGQVTVIGGSSLFHGAPLFSLKVASRIVDMVFFSSPDSSVGGVANLLKSKLLSFIWVPWGELEDYIIKSDAILIGPGFMRYRTEKNEQKNPEIYDEASNFTKKITEKFLKKFSDKKWVVDAGSLQVLNVEWIPRGAILTPNKREYERLFGNAEISEVSKKHKCTIILKGVEDIVSTEGKTVVVSGGNAGLSKGGTGDTLAGLVVSLYAKNEALLSATAASYIVKKTGDALYEEVGTNFNADDLSDVIPRTLANLRKSK